MAKRRRKTKLDKTTQMLITFGVIAAVALSQTTIFLVIGMLPTIVAWLADRSKKRTLVLTVGAMNLAGCSPFLIQLWSKGHTLDLSLSIISDPFTVVVMYSAAGIGYIIDWALSGIVAKIMIERARGRVKAIKERQADLIERWGREVTGEIPIDPYGFPIKAETPEADGAETSDKNEEDKAEEPAKTDG